MNSDSNHHAETLNAVDEQNQNGPPLSLSERVRSLRLPERFSSAGGPRLSWLPWALCGLLAVLSIYLGFRSSRAEPAAAEGGKQGSPAVAAGLPTKPEPGKAALVAGGYVIPVHRVQVSPKVGGEVIELFIEEGQDVKKGQLLARLDPAKYEFEYRRMSALAEQAKAEHEKMQTGFREEEKKQTEASLREAEELRDQVKDEAHRIRQSRQAVSPEESTRVESKLSQALQKVEQLKQAYKMMVEGYRKEDVEKAKSAYLHAVAQRDNAKYDLDSTKVIAPISGRILVKRAEIGNTVRPEAFSNGLSASLCDMADIRDLEVDVDISERDLDRVFPDQCCEIRTEAFPDKVYQGQVARLMPEANRSKASVSARVRIQVPPNDALLRPEMRARVTFLVTR